ncbi:MAG: CidA/LrgA family protein [Lachnospiraceae bacterium]|nr:CidA/LrgA family protein [Lachnospiraceae bacterium]
MKAAKEISLILGITCIGELLNQLLPLPVPAGVYGLFLMLALLCSGVVRLEDVEGTGNFLLDNMSPMFIPAGVGIIRYMDQIRAVGIPYLLINAISTVIVFVITGKVAQWVMQKTEKKVPDREREEAR